MLISVLLGLIVLAVIFYIIRTLIPLPPPFDVLLNVVVAIVAIVLILQLFGFGGTSLLGGRVL